MPVTIIWDTIPNAILRESIGETTPKTGRLVRPGVIHGLDSSLTHAEILFAAREALEADTPIGSEHEEENTYILWEYAIAPVSAGKATFEAIYRSDGISGASGGDAIYILEDDTTLISLETNLFWNTELVPPNWDAIKLGISPEFLPSGTPKQSVVNRQGSAQDLFPARTIKATISRRGTPPNNPGRYVGYVNSDETFKDEGRAAWIISNIRTVSSYSPFYTLSASITKAVAFKDWRTTILLRSDIDGRYLYSRDHLQIAIDREYVYGPIFGVAAPAGGFDETNKGIFMAGRHPMISFTELFGFTG